MVEIDNKEKVDYLFKFIIIGDTGVGKSCILNQYLRGKCKKYYLSAFQSLTNLIAFLQSIRALSIQSGSNLAWSMRRSIRRQSRCKYGTLQARNDSSRWHVAISEALSEFWLFTTLPGKKGWTKVCKFQKLNEHSCLSVNFLPLVKNRSKECKTGWLRLDSMHEVRQLTWYSAIKMT